MHRLLLVAENSERYFFSKMIDHLVGGLLERDVEVVILPGERCTTRFGDRVEILDHRDFRFFAGSRDEHHFTIALDVAREQGVDRVHFARLYDPQKLCMAMESRPPAGIAITGLEYGFQRYFRFPTWAHYTDRLLDHPDFARFIIQSNAPASLTKAIADTKAGQHPKLELMYEKHWLHEQKI